MIAITLSILHTTKKKSMNRQQYLNVAAGRTEFFAVLDFAATALPISCLWQQHEVSRNISM
jgi:hypothetical protein